MYDVHRNTRVSTSVDKKKKANQLVLVRTAANIEVFVVEGGVPSTKIFMISEKIY